MAVFVDSGGWIALLDRRDGQHQRARRFYRTLNRTNLLTSNYVILETLNWFARRGNSQLFHEFRSVIESGRKVRMLNVAWVTESLHNQAWDLLEGHRALRLSFIDCSSVIVCHQNRVDSVFTFDSDFRTMGFDVRPAP